MLQNEYHQKDIDKGIKNQSTKLHNTKSIKRYKQNTTKNM